MNLYDFKNGVATKLDAKFTALLPSLVMYGYFGRVTADDTIDCIIDLDYTGFRDYNYTMLYSGIMVCLREEKFNKLL